MNDTKKPLRTLVTGLGIFQVFISLGALSGGLGLILKPDGSNLGFSVELLGGSPFPDYLIPGLFLFIVNGAGSLAGGIATFIRWRYAGEAAMALGVILILWIVAQVWFIGMIHWLQPLYFGFGIVEAGLGFLLRKIASCSTGEVLL